MSTQSGVALGLVVAATGVGLIGLLLLVLRIVDRVRLPLEKNQIWEMPETASQDKAALIVESGGRVRFMNKAARKLFNLRVGTPHLESLARRVSPRDAFIDLCATEGKTDFSINGCFTEGFSYVLPVSSHNGSGQQSAMFVTLHLPRLVLDAISPLSVELMDQESAATAGEGASVARALELFSDLNQALSSSLDLDRTVRIVLEQVGRLLPCDWLQLSLYDAETETLEPYQLRLLDTEERRMKSRHKDDAAVTGFSRELIARRKRLSFQNQKGKTALGGNQDEASFPYLSYIGVPLITSGEAVGTLELAALQPARFSAPDLQTLQLLSEPAASALRNARLYQQEQQRSQKLAGLSNLTQSVSALSEPQDLYCQMVASIQPLVPVEVLGFLTYDDNHHLLRGETPFLGITDNVVGWYQTAIEPDSRSQELLQSPTPIVTDDAISDPLFQLLDLDHLAQAAGFQHCALQPLAFGGRNQGFLLAARKKDRSAFDAQDLRLLASIAGQAAPIIDNAHLVQQSRLRTQRAETLRRIASLIASAATLDEILKYSLVDLARLLQVDFALIYRLDEARGLLCLHRASLFGLEADACLQEIPLETTDYGQTVTASQQMHQTSDLSLASDDSPILKSISNAVLMRSAINVPLTARQRAIGELLLGSLKPDYFSQGDIQLVVTAAGQLATAMDGAALNSQSDQVLRQKYEEMSAITRLNRELNRTTDLKRLLSRALEEAQKLCHADCGGIVLFQISDERRQLNNHKGDKTSLLPQALVSSGEKTPLLFSESDEKRLLAGETIVVQDFNHDNAEKPHPDLRSRLVLPLVIQARLIGLIDLHAQQNDRFGEHERSAGEALAGAVATTLANLLRSQDQFPTGGRLQKRLKSYASLVEVLHDTRVDTPMEQSLAKIAAAIQTATPFKAVQVCIFNEQTGLPEWTRAVGIPPGNLERLSSQPLSRELLQALCQRKYMLGSSFYIPADSPAAILAELPPISGENETGLVLETNGWSPKDLLIMPLRAAAGTLLGYIRLAAPLLGSPPDQSTAEMLDLFATQTSELVQRQSAHVQLAEQVENLKERAEMAATTAEDFQRQNALLEKKKDEQTSAIKQLDRELATIKSSQVIVNRIGGANTPDEVYDSLGESLINLLGFDLVLIAEPVTSGIKLTGSYGLKPTDADPKALLGQENPLRPCLQKLESLFVSNVKASREWKHTPLLQTLGVAGFVCFSIPGTAELPGVRPRAAILAMTRKPVTPFGASDEHIFSVLAGQAAFALDNLEYIEATTGRMKKIDLLLGFSQQLGTLEIDLILRTLVQNVRNVVPAAQSVMAALWDEKRNLLVPRCASGYRDEQELMAIAYQRGEGLPGQVFERRRSVNLGEVNFTIHYHLSPENFRHYRNATGARLPISSLAVPIISGAILSETDGDPEPLNPAEQRKTAPLGVLALDSAQTSAAFTDEDLAIVVSLVQQTALNLENARLYQASEQRTAQLQALTDASTHLTASLDRQTLVGSLLDQLRSLLPFDTGTLWLRERERGVERLRIVSASGFTDNEQRLGLIVDVADSLLMEEMLRSGKPIWAPNVKQDVRFHSVIMESILEDDHQIIESHPRAQTPLSWLGVPMISSGQVLGVIALEKTEPDFYTPADIQAATMFAAQAAAGLDNATLYQESIERLRVLDEQSQTLTALNRLSVELNGTLDAGAILSFAIQEFQQLVPCTSITVLKRTAGKDQKDDGSNLSNEDRPVAETGYEVQYETPLLLSAADDVGAHASIPDTPIFERIRETLGVFTTQEVGEERDLASLEDLLAAHQTRSLLIVPLASAGGYTGGLRSGIRLFGFLLAHHSEPHRYDHTEIALARTICNLTATALHNAQLYAETRDLSNHLELRVIQRTAELTREQQRLETLVQIITELSTSLDLNQVLTRTLNVLGEFVNAEQIMILIARPGQEQLQCISSVARSGNQRQTSRDDPQQLEQILGQWIVSNSQRVLINDIRKEGAWLQHLGIDCQQERYRNVLGVPLMSGAEALGCLILLHSQPDIFSADQLELIQAAGNQVSISVNNAELYRLIRDQAEDLGGMLRRQQIETTRSKAILEAVADGVLVTDASHRVTLFNRSAENLFALPRNRALGASLEAFTSSFNGIMQKWQERIQQWSFDPDVSATVETYAQELTLENGRALSVHLAPVSVRNEFLGTVSIIQDITQRIEVDRLKTEFVATVSHELRTPMTSIKGYVEILLMGAAGQLTPQQNRFLEVVRSNADRLGLLVDDLLDISQIEAGKLHLTKRPVRIEEVLDQVICDLYRRNTGTDRQVEIIKELAPDLPIVMADASQIHKVLDNLLENACQYNLADGQVCVRVRQVDEEIQVDIKDNGVGITLAEKEQIFERFYRGANSLALGISGTGLGLSIVKNLVQMHDGRIWVESLGLPGAGSTFSFTLPVFPPDKQEGG